MGRVGRGGEWRGRERGMDGRRGERRGFSNVWNFNCQCALQCQYASPFQILCRSVEPIRIHGRFSIFQDGGRPPSWIYQKWPTQREPNLAPSRNWYLMVISISGPEMVLVEQFEQSQCFRRLSPLTTWFADSFCPKANTWYGIWTKFEDSVYISELWRNTPKHKNMSDLWS